LTGRKFNHFGPKPLFIFGCLLQGLGILALSQIAHAGDYGLQVAAFALMGFGGSLCSSTAQSSAFLHIADEQLADASALWNINRQLSFCLGVALLSLLLNLLLEHFTPAVAYKSCFLPGRRQHADPHAAVPAHRNRAIVRRLNTQQEHQ
jgi:MFS family permease